MAVFSHCKSYSPCCFFIRSLDNALNPYVIYVLFFSPESFSESSSTDVSETSKEVPISECKEEDKKETMDAGDQGKAREEKKESKKEEREVKARKGVSMIDWWW